MPELLAVCLRHGALRRRRLVPGLQHDLRLQALQLLHDLAVLLFELRDLLLLRGC